MFCASVTHWSCKTGRKYTIKSVRGLRCELKRIVFRIIIWRGVLELQFTRTEVYKERKKKKKGVVLILYVFETSSSLPLLRKLFFRRLLSKIRL